MLTERWRPHDTTGLMGQAAAIASVRQWLARWRRGKALLLSGPVGCGKTALVRALAAEQQLTLVEMDADSMREIPDIGTSVQQATLGKGELILIDEIDAADGTTAGKALRMITTSRWPVLLTANDPYVPALRELRRSCDIIKLASPRPSEIEQRLLKIAAAEGLSVRPEAIKAIAASARGDVRAAINDLELLGAGAVPGLREHEAGPFELLGALFRGQCSSARSALEHSNLGPDAIFSWIETNIGTAYRNPARRADAFDLLSRADLQRKRNARRVIDMLASLALIRADNGSFRPPERIFGQARAERAATERTCEELARELHCSRRTARTVYFPFLKLYS